MSTISGVSGAMRLASPSALRTASSSGKLTLTFPRNSTETLFGGHPERGAGTQDAGESTPTIKWTEGLDIGYRWYASAENTNRYKPLFAFGHGLSYTSFDYSGLTTKLAKNGGVDVTFTVENTGARTGGESPQVYVGPSTQLPSGLKQAQIKLAQFDHVELAPGESQTLTLNVSPRVLSSWSPAAQNWVLGTGARRFWVGAASDDLPLTAVRNVPAAVAAPTVTANPSAGLTTTPGSTVTLAAHASGTPTPAVAWQKSTDGGASWSPIASATSETLTFTAAALDDKAQYRAAFSNELGDAISNAAVLSVTGSPATLPATPPATPATAPVTKGKPSVSFSLSRARVSTRTRASVTVKVTAPSGLKPTGNVTVTVLHGGKT